MPETGTFLSVDPVESEPPYLYVRVNPVNYVDPSGLLKNYIIARELGFSNFDEVIEAFALDGDPGHERHEKLSCASCLS